MIPEKFHPTRKFRVQITMNNDENIEINQADIPEPDEFITRLLNNTYFVSHNQQGGSVYINTRNINTIKLKPL